MEFHLSEESRQKSRMTGEAIKESSCAEDLPLIPLMMRILANKQPAEIAQLAKKLNTEGIREANSLKVLPRNLIERRLSQKLNLGEVADVLEVWTALQTSHKGKSKASHSKKNTSQVTTKGLEKEVQQSKKA